MTQAERQPSNCDYLFSLYDTDSDGLVSADDYARIARRIIDAFGRDATAPEARSLLKQYEQAWQRAARFDTDDDGQVTQQEFRRALANSPQKTRGIVDALAWQLIEPFDLSSDGQVRYEEFRRAVTDSGRGGRQPSDDARALRDAEFAVADTDGDGMLRPQEFLTLVQAFGPSAEEAQLALQHMGVDGNAGVTRAQYVAAWENFAAVDAPEHPASAEMQAGR